MTIGQAIKKARQQKEFTQKQLATAIDAKTCQISLWETGKTFPSIINFISLAEVLGVTLDELVGRSSR
jgi:transcriptional regulator with XRE-family HTH domain